MKIDKDNIKIILILLVVALGIGYSYLNTDLAINGTANINSANWNVYWNNVQVKSGSVEAATPTISNQTTVNFNVTLAEPGDYYEFTVDAVNAGTLDAMIDTMDSKLNGVTIEELPAYLDYGVTYADDTPIDVDQELLHDSTETYKVRIAYADYIEASDLPSTNQSLSLEFSVTYKQADDTSQAIHNISYVYSVGNVETGNEWPEDLEMYDTAAEVMSSNKNRPFYLKHKLDNNIVVENYVEFIITPEMAQANPGMTAGTYTLRTFNAVTDDGLDCKSEYVVDDKCIGPYYEDDKLILSKAFGSSNCNEQSISYEYNYNEYSCEVSNFSASIRSAGSSAVWMSPDGECYASYDEAYCELDMNTGN